ncbi:radical SAM family heme chaperone HemW [Brevibacillus humidisoli]|uniref:radical SAM family heme chaperone HemW n=1 Tax=Brevibacillus humidisoli TaxID=2895522 RepID=UPI001E38680B|nr:radical SAM family heme chaperone HemW [Brevibacillus humidisoli]UFJ43176.1 radical SAM family heme chaperone HemW [Brevibacillus humidisoli]
MPPRSVYIHIPFCTNKCYYCDFNSFVTNNPQLIWDYLYALEREMERTFSALAPQQVETIFVGGGTPTFLDRDQMHFFLETVQKHLGSKLTSSYEFSMEANPGTTDHDKLTVMRAFGVNRLSFGAQSFDDRLLKRLGRIHSADEVRRSVETALMAGFDNISIDLMFGLPEQTLADFERSIGHALALPLSHLSAYSLKVEENTLFHTLYQKEQLPLPSEEDELAMYLMLIDRMEQNGLMMYEISNFAKPGRESRHNQTYWLNEEYYGIGAGAHGYVQGRRHVNAGPLAVYMQMAADGLPRVEEYAVEAEEAMENEMILGLRLRRGVDLERFAHRYGRTVQQEFGEVVSRQKEKGMLEESEGYLRLTRQALPVGNEVFMQFLRD